MRGLSTFSLAFRGGRDGFVFLCDGVLDVVAGRDKQISSCSQSLSSRCGFLSTCALSDPQVLSRRCAPYDAITEELMALGPPHLWCFFFGHPSVVPPSLKPPSSSVLEGGGDGPFYGNLQVSQLLLPGTMPSCSPEICKELAPLLKAYLDDLDRGISRRFLYDYWVLQRRAVPPSKGELGMLVFEARHRWDKRLSKSPAPAEEEGGDKPAVGLTETVLAKFWGGRASGAGGGGGGRSTLVTKTTLEGGRGATNGQCATEITKE